MKRTFLLGCILCSSAGSVVAQEQPAIEEVKVWGEQGESRVAERVGPVSTLEQADFASINMATTEDVVKHEPSVVIRRRFIGDSNGTLGIRSANMFQTSRSMVFADGVPLHYLLQSRWSGAPRWTMVSASEIARVDVVYGPFSAEYSGNAMGGVVLIETAIPQKREVHIDGSFFSQSFDDYGHDGNVDGYKGFASYGDKFGDFSVYLSYNHLNNEAQPQSFYYAGAADASGAVPVAGGIYGQDSQGIERLYFGDSGVVDTQTDNIKFKLGYDVDAFSALFNVAFEDRQSETFGAHSYLSDTQGQTVWGGTIEQDGSNYSVPAQRFNVSAADRESLNLGLRLRAELSPKASLEANISQFKILDDENRSSAVNPEHPSYDLNGQVSDYEDTGWDTFGVTLNINDFAIDGLDWVSGARYESYELNYQVLSSTDYLAGAKDSFTSASGGTTDIAALFTQFNWQINDTFDVALGLRYEDWSSQDGYYSDDNPNTAEFDLVSVPGNDMDKFSPKFSFGYRPNADWQLRYSLGRAYRFAIVEELFSQYEAYNSISEANPTLQPENGLHQNFMLQRELSNGYLRLNIYQDTIEDVIESQSTILPGGSSIRTFIPVDKVRTRGVELVANANDFIVSNLDVRINLTYTDAKIIANNADPSIVGNTFSRMPEWRGNLLATYHLSDRWNIGGSLQYASDSFGRLDNTDTADNVYGAQDGYTRVGLKTNYAVNRQFTLSLGVDNVTNEIAYVAHPWPGRTVFINFSYDL
ncbi:TonB-dependent receptor [Gilvimarinus agarilyticus]|uniref:TonB-dependent receptor n=1 Tax=Gilvimarinus sp. 2_MG-2023 TaxID=3062666 RepID=UPI001C099578|nr:TonB-dependent receptor [Gilvimarinus sp. 2_MG-2023]MBU2886151.1 TonB-dependent receptor [Gilvimarinus agarilyticus]MDO6570861.1 TonB-dependent receptor [Gilvimarinus sp. 2_MG-2023]